MTIKVCARGFSGPFAGVNHPERKEQVGAYDFLRAMVTVGRSGWPDAFAGGYHRWFEIAGTIFETLAYAETMKGNLVATDVFWELDASEKAVFSYKAGQALAKLVVESHLDVPWLTHLSRLVKRGVVNLSPNTSQHPDLVGRDWSNNWHVVEAKGRSNFPESRLLRQAKAQAQAVIAVRGKPPSTSCGCVSLLYRRPFAVEIEDPRDEPLNPIEVAINDDGFFRMYYDLVEGMRLSGDRIESRYVDTAEGRVGYQVVRIPETTVGVGIRSEIFTAYGADTNWRVLLSEIQDSLRTLAQSETQAGYFSLGPDGIGVFDLERLKETKLPIIRLGPSTDMLSHLLRKKDGDPRRTTEGRTERPLVVA